MQHGCKKESVQNRPAAQLIEERAQVRKGRQLFDLVLQRNLPREKMLEVTKKAVMLSPEFSTLWNVRREAFFGQDEQQVRGVESLEDSSSQGQDEGHPQSTLTITSQPGDRMNRRRELLAAELGLLDKAMVKARKLYCLWNHRRWVVDKLIVESSRDEDNDQAVVGILQGELKQVKHFFQLDARNFHAWNYRDWLLRREKQLLGKKKAARNAEGGKEGEEDRSLSESLILENFSNYSAWHLRGKSCGDRFRRNPEELDRELDWLQQAIFTEPNDQSVWFYHEFLLLRNRGNHVVEYNCRAAPACSSRGGAVVFVLLAEATTADRIGVSCSWAVSSPSTGSAKQCTVSPLGRSAGVLEAKQKDVVSRAFRIELQDVDTARALDAKDESAASSHPKQEPLTLSVTVSGSGPEAGAETSSTLRIAPSSHQDLPILLPPTAESAVYLRPALSVFSEGVTAALVQREIERIEELLEIEPECPLAVLAKARLLEAVHVSQSRARPLEADDEERDEEGGDGTGLDAIVALYDQLTEMDRMRAGYYLDQKQRLLEYEGGGGGGTGADGGRFGLAGLLAKAGGC